MLWLQNTPCCIISSKTSTREGLFVGGKKTSELCSVAFHLDQELWKWLFLQWWGLSTSTEHHMFQREKERTHGPCCQSRSPGSLIIWLAWSHETLNRTRLTGPSPMTSAEEPQWSSESWNVAARLASILSATIQSWKGFKNCSENVDRFS